MWNWRYYNKQMLFFLVCLWLSSLPTLLHAFDKYLHSHRNNWEAVQTMFSINSCRLLIRALQLLSAELVWPTPILDLYHMVADLQKERQFNNSLCQMRNLITTAPSLISHINFSTSLCLISYCKWTCTLVKTVAVQSSLSAELSH
jgi:hypothetical protein